MKWEYKTLKFFTKGIFGGGKVDEMELGGVLNQFGSDGWELASSFVTAEGMGNTREIILIMKRQK